MAGTVGIRCKLVLISSLLVVTGCYALHFVVGRDLALWPRICGGLLGALFLIMGGLVAWLASMRISYGHTLASAALQVIFTLRIILGRHAKAKPIRESWKHPRKSQEGLLKKILDKNSRTAYGKEYGLGSVTSLEDLREKHPLTTYERYRPYIDRLGKGENGLMTDEPIVRFALSSGTTGKAKMIPYSKSFLASLFGEVIGLAMDVQIRSFGIGSLLQREINLYTAPKQRLTECGILMGPASLMSKWMKPLIATYATPSAGFGIRDPSDSTYVHMLFGLRDRNLRGFKCRFVSNLMSAMRLVESRWPDLVRDIKEGTVTTKNVSPDIHRSLVRSMGGGDPQRATELKQQFEKGFDGLIRRVWPHLERIQGIDSSGMKDTLLNSYAKGVPFYAQVFAATEGMVGYNLWPCRKGKDRFVLLPTLTVMEFIPEDKIYEDQPDTFFMDELQVGGVYELVITQLFGVYRFRFGDVIKVVDYHHETPVVEFLYRVGQMLNVHEEKMDQSTVQKAVAAAVSQWDDVTLREYAVAESTLLDQLEKTGPAHEPCYLVFIELEPAMDEELLQQLSLHKVDEELRRNSFTYDSFRNINTIAPPHVHVVAVGTFGKLHDFILDHSTTTENQYKVPRKLRTKEMVKLLLDNSVYHSI